MTLETPRGMSPTSSFRLFDKPVHRSRGPAIAAWIGTAVWVAVAPAYLSLLGVLQWKALPFPRSDRIVQVNAGFDLAPELAKSSVFEAVSVFESGWLVIGTGNDSLTALGATVDDGFFKVLGQTPLSGRGFAADGAGGVLVSQSLNQKLQARFGSGGWLRAGERVLPVRGVIADRPTYPPNTEVWVLRTSRIKLDSQFLPVNVPRQGILCRLAPGVTVHTAGSIVAQLAREWEASKRTMLGDVELVTLEHLQRRSSTGERGLLITCMAGILFFVFLGYSGALTALLEERQGEFSVRRALGAGPWDLFRLLMHEIAALAVPGFAVGLLISRLVLERLTDLVPPALAQLVPPAVDMQSVSVTAAAWVLVATSSGLGAWLSAPHLSMVVTRPDRLGASRKGRRAGARLAVLCAFLGLAVAVGTISAVLRQSLANLRNEPLGFQPEGAVSAVLRFADPPDQDDLPRQLARIASRIEGLEGVASVAYSDAIPLGTASRFLEISESGQTSAARLARVQQVHGNYLAAVGLELRSGRAFSAPELESGIAVALIDEKGARDIFGGSSALGRTIDLGRDRLEVIGIVASTKGSSVAEFSRPQIYIPLLFRQEGTLPAVAMIARSNRPLNEVELDAAVNGLGASISQVRPLSDNVRRSLSAPRLASNLAAIEWAASLILVGVATFGALSWLLEVRAFEFAVRLALGDTVTGIARRVFRDVGVILGVALVLGLVIYLPTSWALRGLLFGAHLSRPQALLQAIVIVSAVAFGASALAARSSLRRLSTQSLMGGRET